MSTRDHQDLTKDQPAKEKNQQSATPGGRQDHESAPTTKSKVHVTDESDPRELSSNLQPPLLTEAWHLGARLLNEYTIRVLFVLVVLLAAFLMFVASSTSSTEARPWATTGWFAIAICVVVFNVLMHAILNHQAKTTLSTTQDSLSKKQEDLMEFITDNLSPSIRVLSEKKEVRAQAASMIKKEQKDVVTALRNITYFGAASLGPTPNEQTLIEERKTNTDKENVETATGFRDAFYNALVDNVKVNRYIQLADKATFADRGANQREEYLKWLANQIGLLESHRSYTLLNSRRGSPFGSTRSTIVTDKGFLDIIGQGNEISGVLVNGAEIAKLIRDRTIEFLKAAKVKENRPQPINFALTGTVPELKTQLSDLTKLHKKLKNKEQRTTAVHEGESKDEKGKAIGKRKRSRKK